MAKASADFKWTLKNKSHWKLTENTNIYIEDKSTLWCVTSLVGLDQCIRATLNAVSWNSLSQNDQMTLKDIQMEGQTDKGNDNTLKGQRVKN